MPFFCLGFIKNETFTSMHKLHQRFLPLDPTGIILKTCCNSTGAIQTFCLYKIDPQDEEILYLVPRSIFINMARVLFVGQTGKSFLRELPAC